MNGVKSFLGELRRRHVFRVAAWYAVAAWLVIQIATNTFPHLMFPDWTVRFVIILCLIGFPIAVTLAWALEVTPEGLMVVDERARPVSRSSTPPWRSTSMWLALAGGGLLGAGSMQAWKSMVPESERTAETVQAPVPARILAVLPFENLGGDENNAAFTAGIHDSLITRIAKIGGMTVISRTSVMSYAKDRPNLKDIAKALGVTHVVEGSVQRAGEQVRIQAQLIDAATDLHLWAETYDRTLAEGFATQNEIATAIARELSVRLSDVERKTLQNLPTQNAKAFEQYILGHAEIVRWEYEKAIAHLQSAVQSDPDFALGFAELSMAFTDTGDLDGARKAYERALSLQPDLPEGILARGVYQSIGIRDYAAAESDLTAAVDMLPNSYEAHNYLSLMRRRQDRWVEAARLAERAAAIEPVSHGSLAALFNAYLALGQRKPIERAVRRALDVDPKATWPVFKQALMMLVFDGDLAGHVAAMERLHALEPDDEEMALYLAQVYHTQGRFLDAVKILEAYQGEMLGLAGLREMEIGWAYLSAGDKATADRWFEASLEALDAEGLHKKRWDLVANAMVTRAYVLAGLGRRDEAAANVREALLSVPREKDATEWDFNASSAFAVLGLIGDTRGAVDLVEQLLNSPNATTPYYIWFYWAAAPLRANPEFRELMARHGVDVTRDPRTQTVSQQTATGTSN